MLITTHLVKNFDIGLNNNLYGGRMLDWIDEAGALFTRELFPNEKFVTLKIAETIFHNPVHANDVIKFIVNEPCCGKTSLSFKIQVVRNEQIVLSTDLVFVCINDSGEKKEYNPYILEKNIFKQIVFNKAKRFYNNSNNYHNIDHIIDLLNQLDRIDLTNEEYNILCAAICYHDCVYVPGAIDNDNEYQSTVKLQNNIIESKETDIASSIIKSTISFEEKKEYLFCDSPKLFNMVMKLCNIMHDLDYSYFYNFDKLCNADENIENEYLTFITKEQFYNGRKKFLTDLSNKDIYRSVYEQHNKQAKENIIKLLNIKYKD